jgi:hypothetical protein
MRIAVIVVLLLAGCTKTNPDYHKDGGVACTESHDTCVCLDEICVQCTDQDKHNCAGAKPACGADNTCHACLANKDCDSDACLEDGRCADTSQVVYATPGGATSSPCGLAAGQNECSLVQALVEVTAQRNVIRLAPGAHTVTGADGLDFNTKSATVIARGATITRAPTGPIMTVRTAQTLKLVGGTLQGPNGSDGLKCTTNGKLQVHETIIESMGESGIESDGCELTISRATLRRNDVGGINMVGAVKVATITNNLVYRNGKGGASPVGGMVLRLAAGSKIEYNTVVDNQTDLGASSAGGIACEGQGYDALYNLIYRNTGGIGGAVQVIGTCTFMGSYNKAAASADENGPAFQNPNDGVNPSFRLTAQSPVGTIKDGITCSNPTLIDFEGDSRPAPTGGKCDFGADEYRDGQ